MKNTKDTLEKFAEAELQKLGRTKSRLISKADVKEIFGIGSTVVERWVAEGLLMPVLESQKIKYMESQVGELVQKLILRNAGK